MTSDQRLSVGRRRLGEALRARRDSSGRTLRELAESTGVSISHLSDCERGRAFPSWALMLRLADTYGVLVTSLLADVYPWGTDEDSGD